MSEIITKTGPLPGKTLAIFAGVHGNEPAGVLALKQAVKEIEIESGTVHFVIANPEAVKVNKRYLEKNLNRCFIRNQNGTTLEEKLAIKLMAILDEADALLDLHGYNGPEDQPFLICEQPSFDVARYLNFSIVSSGWSATEAGGTDGYMFEQGKVGICAECGSNFRPEQYQPQAFQTIKTFLRYFGAVSGELPDPKKDQIIIQVNRFYKKKTDKFSFVQEFNNFDQLPAGKVFATDGQEKLTAGENERIIFPRANAIIGEEACIIGTETKNPAP